MPTVKTAISLADTTFARVEALARELKVPRSRIFALAVEEFLERNDSRNLLAALNRAYADSPTATERRWRRGMQRRQRVLLEGEW